MKNRHSAFMTRRKEASEAARKRAAERRAKMKEYYRRVKGKIGTAKWRMGIGKAPRRNNAQLRAIEAARSGAAPEFISAENFDLPAGAKVTPALLKALKATATRNKRNNNYNNNNNNNTKRLTNENSGEYNMSTFVPNDTAPHTNKKNNKKNNNNNKNNNNKSNMIGPLSSSTRLEMPFLRNKNTTRRQNRNKRPLASANTTRKLAPPPGNYKRGRHPVPKRVLNKQKREKPIANLRGVFPEPTKPSNRAAELAGLFNKAPSPARTNKSKSNGATRRAQGARTPSNAKTTGSNLATQLFKEMESASATNNSGEAIDNIKKYADAVTKSGNEYYDDLKDSLSKTIAAYKEDGTKLEVKNTDLKNKYEKSLENFMMVMSRLDKNSLSKNKKDAVDDAYFIEEKVTGISARIDRLAYLFKNGSRAEIDKFIKFAEEKLENRWR